MTLFACRVVDGNIAKYPALPGGVGLDNVIYAGLRERIFEALLHVVGETLVLDRAGHVDAGAHARGESMRAIGSIGRQPAGMEGGSRGEAIRVRARRGQ